MIAMSSDMLLIDGDCNLCNAISTWIVKHKSKSSVLDILPQSDTDFIQYFRMGGSGADIGPLKDKDIVLAGLSPDSQRYFDHHHASNDTFDAVNKRELELGAATMTSLVYLIDKYGLNVIKSTKELKD